MPRPPRAGRRSSRSLTRWPVGVEAALRAAPEASGQPLEGILADHQRPLRAGRAAGDGAARHRAAAEPGPRSGKAAPGARSGTRGTQPLGRWLQGLATQTSIRACRSGARAAIAAAGGRGAGAGLPWPRGSSPLPGGRGGGHAGRRLHPPVRAGRGKHQFSGPAHPAIRRHHTPADLAAPALRGRRPPTAAGDPEADVLGSSSAPPISATPSPSAPRRRGCGSNWCRRAWTRERRVRCWTAEGLRTRNPALMGHRGRRYSPGRRAPIRHSPSSRRPALSGR